jgi:hypothetical protein
MCIRDRCRQCAIRGILDQPTPRQLMQRWRKIHPNVHCGGILTMVRGYNSVSGNFQAAGESYV